MHVITQPAARQLAEQAETIRGAGDYIRAMMLMRRAFDSLVAEHEPTHRHSQDSSELAFGPRIGPFKLSESQITRMLSSAGESRYAHDYKRFAEQFSDVVKIVEKVQAGMLLTAIGADYPSQVRFLRIVPTYVDTVDGTRHWRQPLGYAPDDNDFDFCMRFVVEISLRLAAAENLTSDPSWLNRDQWGRQLWEDLVDEPIDLVARPSTSEDNV